MPTTINALFAIAAIVLFVVWKYRDRAIGTRQRKDLVGPPEWPILGSLPWLLRDGEHMLEMFVEMRQKYGQFSTFTVPGFRSIDVSRPDLIEFVQKTKFNHFAKGEYQNNKMRMLLGRGIFATDNEEWYKQRKITSQIFTNEQFRGIITSSINQHIDNLVHVINKIGQNGSEDVALSDLFFRFTLDSFVTMAFGQDPNTLLRSEPLPFATAFDYMQVIIDRRFRNPFWPVAEFLTGESRKMKAALRDIDAYAYGVIERREHDLAKGEKISDKDLLSLYMSVRNDTAQPLTKVQLRDAVLNLIIAGRDTSAQLLSWTFFELIRQPKYIKQLREELFTTLGEEAPTYDNFRSLPTFMAIFNESLRLYPSVAKNGWIVQEDIQLPNGGPMVYKDELVRWSDWQMARDPEVWGQDAAVWQPERWLDKSEDGTLICKRESMWKLHSFNGGSRLCLGQNLATFEVILAMAALVKHYDFEFAPDYLANTEMAANAPMYRISLTLPMKTDLLVRARPVGKRET